MIKFTTKRRNGRPVTLEFEDLGLSYDPAYYTSKFIIDGKAADPVFAQVKRELVDGCGLEGSLYRLGRDRECLENYSIDGFDFEEDLDRAMEGAR